MAEALKTASALIRRASEAVAEVSARYGHTGYVSLREGREVTGIADFPGTNTLRVIGPFGRRLKAEERATGRSLLARLSDEEVAEFYSGHDGLAYLLLRLAVIREHVFAYFSQEATPGVDAIAITVAKPATVEAVSLCIVYPHAVVENADHDDMLAALAKGAARIAAEFGDTGITYPLAPEKGFIA